MPATRKILRYRIVAILGEGGFGRVYHARDEALGRDVALKVLRSGMLDTERAEDLLREARVVARLDHPGIVRVHECGVFDGAPYIAMELLEGRTLGAHLAANGPAPASTLVDWAHAILGALGAAHAAGVVHGDVHPGNLFLTRDGGLKILDFGSGVAASAPSSDPTAPRIFGVPGYVAPELYLGERPGPRSDLYAVGATLFRAATQQPPFAGASLEDNRERVLRGRAPALARLAPHLPASLGDAVDRALARDPDARFADAAAFAAAIAGRGDAPAPATRSIAASKGAWPASSPAPEDQARGRRGRIGWWLGGALGAGGLLAGIGLASTSGTKGDPGTDVDVRRGRYTTTQTCDEGEHVRFVDAHIEVDGVGVVAKGNCRLEIVGSTIVADIGIESEGETTVRRTTFSGRRGISLSFGEVTVEEGTFDVVDGIVATTGDLTLRRSTLRASARGIAGETSRLLMEDTKIDAPAGIALGTLADARIVGSRVTSAGVAIATKQADVVLVDSTIVGDVGVLDADTLELRGGKVEGRTAAFILADDGTVEVHGTTIAGRRQRKTDDGIPYDLK